MDSKNHYDVLKIAQSATEDEIRSAYVMALQEALGDKEHFDAVKLAFEVLSDADRRAEYDKGLAPPRAPAPLAESLDEPQPRRQTQRLPRPDTTMALATTMCPVCGYQNPPGEDYCAECGRLLSGTQPAIGTPPEQAVSRPYLEDLMGRSFPLKPGVNTVGRENAEILIADKTISRRQGLIAYDEERNIFSIVDTGSTNGTAVNGRLLRPQNPHPVHPGDEILFGSVSLRLYGAREAAVPVEKATPPPPREVKNPVATLTLIRGTGPSELFLENGVNTIGRLPDNVLCLFDDRYISGFHAQIVVDGSLYRLIDLNSTNGTLLNGIRLTPSEEISISDGDEIALGSAEYRLDVAGTERAAEPIQDDGPLLLDPSDGGLGA